MADAILLMRVHGPRGLVQGECVAERFVDWIHIESWSWSVNGAEDAIRPGAIKVSKGGDRSSAVMMGLLDKQETCPKVEIMLWEGSEVSDLELLVTLREVNLLSFSARVGSGDKGGTVDEDWELSYENIHFRYSSPEVDEPDVKIGSYLECDLDAHAEGAHASPHEAATKQIDSLFAALDAGTKIKTIERLKGIQSGDIKLDGPGGKGGKGGADDPTKPSRAGSSLRGGTTS